MIFALSPFAHHASLPSVQEYSSIMDTLINFVNDVGIDKC